MYLLVLAPPSPSRRAGPPLRTSKNRVPSRRSHVEILHTQRVDLDERRAAQLIAIKVEKISRPRMLFDRTCRGASFGSSWFPRAVGIHLTEYLVAWTSGP